MNRIPGVHRRAIWVWPDPCREGRACTVRGIGAGEGETIARQTGCVSDLDVAPAAKRGLASLGAVEDRVALVQCRSSVRGAQ